MQVFNTQNYAMFNERTTVFYRVENHEQNASDFRPDETRAASLLNDFKIISGKACLNGVDNNDAFVNVVD